MFVNTQSHCMTQSPAESTVQASEMFRIDSAWGVNKKMSEQSFKLKAKIHSFFEDYKINLEIRGE